MTNNNTFRATRYLPQMAVMTALVVVLPVVVVWLLLAEGAVSSAWICIGLAIVLSFTASILGSAYWKRRSGPGDVLFSELLLWGWLHRLQSERRLAKTVGLLGLGGAQPGLSGSDESVERKAQLLRQMATALDAQDPYTDGHSRRVALHAAMIARRMSMSREEVAKVTTAAAVHDVGKLRIPLEVLNKQGVLTTAEFEIVKRHVDEGAAIVSSMEDPELSAMVRHHHERFDGTGYPAGLIGEQIPAGARIIAVADTFDALTSERPYRAAIPHKKALEIIEAVSGTQLDPVAVRAFLRCYSGKRAVLFWTLLAVSPQRALAFLSGRGASRANLGSVATVAMPAALAALVAAAIGTAGSATHQTAPQRLAEHPAVTSGAPQKLQPTRPHSSAPAPASARPAKRSSPAKFVVLALKVTRSRKSGTPAHRSSRVPSGAAGRRPRRHRGGSSHPIVNGSHHPAPPRSGGHRPVKGGGTGTPSPPPVSGGHHPGGSGGSNPPAGGGGNSNPGGGAGNPGGGPGNPGGPEPQSKQDCKDSGWMNFSFPNQGQCVAYVEHSLHG